MSTTLPDQRPRVHVVAAALLDGCNRVLLQRRADNAHQGGLWEFPGGKLEVGESRETALRRELHEELGVRATSMRPLISIAHNYRDRRVLLDVWRVDRWQGEVRAMEGQPLTWAASEDFAKFEFPAADRPVLKALQLPELLLITPSIDDSTSAATARWLNTLTRVVGEGVSLVQVRSPQHSAAQLRSLIVPTLEELARSSRGVRVIINGEPEDDASPGLAGVHLNSTRLWRFEQRPLGVDRLLGVSCHCAQDLHQAHKIDADFAVLGPVAATRSHPDAAPLGWEAFAALVADAHLPVYALGGMSRDDVSRAHRAGAQGVAAISALWH